MAGVKRAIRGARSMVRGKVAGVKVVRGEDGKAVAAPPREITQVLAAIRKNAGENTVVRANSVFQPPRLSTGIFTLDMALCGGLPRGKIADFSGPKHSGKSSTLLKVIAQFQQRFPDEEVVFVDAEHTYDPVWAAVHGVNNDRLLIVKPDTAEQAVDLIDALIRTYEVGLIGLDSIAAMVPIKVQETSAEDNDTPGLHAKLVTKLVAKVNSALLHESKRQHYPTMVCTNQWRAGIGKWAPPGQEALTSPGGKAYEHYVATRTIFKNHEKIDKDDQGFDMLAYNEHSFKIDKNKFNAGIRAGEFQMMRRDHESWELHTGEIDDAAIMLTTAKRMGIYSGGGRAWKLELPDFEQTFGNADEAIEFLYANRDTKQLMRNHLIALHAEKLGMPDYFIKSIYEM